MKENVRRAVIAVLSVIVIIALSVILFKVFRAISTEEGRIGFRNYIMRLGPLGCLILIGINVSQIFLFFVPGEFVELLAGMCYGTFGGLIVTYAGAFISACIIFWLIRRVGKMSAYDLIGEDKVEKIEKSRIFNSRNAERILLLLFVIPGTPKDLLLYIGALLPVKAWRFMILSTLFRFPGIITSTIAGAHFARGDNRTAVTVYIVTFIASLIILWIFARRDEIREIMDINRDK